MATVDWINGAIRAAIPAIVISTLYLCRKWLPSRALTRQIDWDSDKLYKRFRPMYWKVLAGGIIVMAVIAIGLSLALSWINSQIANLSEPRAIHLLPETAIWYGFPGFAALVSCYEITLQIGSLFAGRETIDFFSDWMDNTSRGWIRSRYTGIDSRRILRWMMAGIAFPAGIATLLALPMHAGVGPEIIEDCGYAFKPCRTYPLAQTVRVTEIAGFRDKSGKLIDRAGLVLDFADGRRWASAKWGEWNETVDPALVAFVLSKTGLKLRYAPAEQDIPPLPPSK
jgi:hypothetical protein